MVRFPYKNGDLKASGPPETLVADLPPGGDHLTRDIVFSKDGKKLFVAVGSAANVSDTRPSKASRQHSRIQSRRQVREHLRLRHSQSCGPRDQSDTGELWCSVNERDELGDNLVPDYITT